MYEKLIHRGLDFIYMHGNFSETDREIYEYGLGLVFMYVINAGILLVLGLIIGRFFQTLLVLVCFALLQSYAGGYHATTHYRCLFLMLTFWAASMLALPMIEPHPWISIPFAFFSLFTVYALAPIQHKNFPLSKHKEQIMRKVARLITLTLSGLSLIGVIIPATIPASSAIGISLFLSAVSMLSARLKNQL